MFKSYGFPYEGDNGDIEKMNYLFLGDYVDRGQNSVIILQIKGRISFVVILLEDQISLLDQFVERSSWRSSSQ